MTGIGLSAFVEATLETFERMVKLEAVQSTGGLDSENTPSYDVSGIVGISGLGANPGQSHLSVVLSFSEATACRAVGRILGIDGVGALDMDVVDGIGELVNVIVGAAKRRLDRLGIAGCRASLPSVVLGAQHRILRQSSVECYTVHFASALGPFRLQIFFRRGAMAAMP